MKTSLSVDYIETSSGKKGQRSVTDINPLATTESILQFVHDLVGLTTNTYSQTNRIQTINVDTESIPGGGSTPKPVPTITVNPSSVEASQVYTQPYVTISASVNGDSISPMNIYTKVVKTNANYFLQHVNPPETGTYRINASNGTATAQTLEGIIMIPETDDYAAAYANIVLT